MSSPVRLTGGAYTAHNVIASAQRSLNLYSEPMPQGEGEPAPAANYPTPGTRLLGAIGTGPIRCIRQAINGNVYVVSGDNVYSVDATTWVGSSLGSLTAGLKTPVSMTDNGLDMLIVDGSSSGWSINLAANTMAPVSDPTGRFLGGDKVDYLDTFFLLNNKGTPQFYISGSLALTFDRDDLGNMEAASNLLVTLIVARREVYLLGTLTTEIWYDVGATGPTDFSTFQFAPVQGVFVDHGCVAKYSAASYDNTVFWLSRNRQGRGVVMTSAGYQTKRVSTYAIEAAIQLYARIDDAIGFCYQIAGHTFYVLTFPHADHTWCYDVGTGLWHEWAWIDSNGDEHRHRANAFWPVNDLLVVGDWQNGNLYALDQTAFTDNGNPIKRVRTYPHLITDARRVFYREFIADMDVGNPGAPPTITTSTEQIITWPPEIASLTGFFATTPDMIVAPDWQRGLVYFVDLNNYGKYALSLATQPPIVITAADGHVPAAATVEPLSGDLIVQRNTANGSPILKLDPNTFAVLASFGSSAGIPSYPASVWTGNGLVCIVCNGVPYALTEFDGEVAAIRADMMTQAGFDQNVVHARCVMCAGASGGSTATAFLAWQGGVYNPTVPVYVVTVSTGAETYNPSTWPATNPHITHAAVGAIAASVVDPTQPNMAVSSLGYDLADGNLLLHVSTGTTTGSNFFIIKVRSTDAAVLWSVPVDALVRVSLEQSRINGSLWVFESTGTGTSWRIDTLTGHATIQPLNGATYTAPGEPVIDSENAVALFWGSFAIRSGSPVPVSGTGAFTNGWALMGGATEVTTITTAAAVGNLISLRWSDDRGHSYGSLVSQPIGATGEYRKSLQWQRLGMCRDRVFEISWSTPMATALQGAWVTAEVADADTPPKEQGE